MRKSIVSFTAGLLAAGTILSSAFADENGHGGKTATPIKHLVVIFQENVSFDHYFATYPHATNPGASRASLPARGRRRSTACRVPC